MGERLATVEAQLLAIRDDVNEKHQQNRKSIHELRNGQQDTDDKLDTIHDLVQRILGMGQLSIAVGGILGTIWVVLQIKQALSH